MRPIISGLVTAALATCSLAQKLEGAYATVPWQINSHGTLVWNSTPYLPVGVALEPTKASIDAAKAAGLSDLLVDLPAGDEGWDEAITDLERNHLRYLIRISSLTPMAKGVCVDPAAYRIASVSGKRHLDIPLGDATEALVVVAQKRDGAVEKSQLVPVTAGRLVYDVKVTTSLDDVVLIYPITAALSQPDYWEELDAHRDRLLTALRKHQPGAGLRGFVNPLGKTLTLPGKDLRFVPSSPAFRSEFAQYLENHYRNVVSVLRSWSMGSQLVSTTETGEDKASILTFDDLARFVPLWSGTRGVSEIWDPKRNKLDGCDKVHSTIWKDLTTAINASENRRYQRLVTAIRAVADVPVVQEWSGWAAPYEGGEPTVDGIGMKAFGTSPSEIVGTASKATSSLLRWKTPGWLPATEINLGTGDAVASELPGVLDDLTSLGARGIFVRAESPALLKAVAAEAVKRADDVTPSQGSPRAIFFPENATNPATVQRLPGGFWWLPSPADGERIDFGAGFNGYRMATDKGTQVVIWCNRPQRVLLRLANAKKVDVATMDGSNADPRLSKGGMEVTITQTPLILSNTDEIPVPQTAYDQTKAEIEDLIATALKQHRELTDVLMDLRDAEQAFDQNPGGVFPKLRMYLHRMDAGMGAYTWIELESPVETNFSEVGNVPGCSGGRCLNLNSAIESPEGFYADYEVPTHTKEDQEVWLAARIDPQDRQNIVLRVSGENLPVTGNPVGLYGNGFGWYHVGTTKSLEATAKMRLLVLGQAHDFAADAVVFSTASFRPDGVFPPETPVDLTARKIATRHNKGDSRRKSGP